MPRGESLPVGGASQPAEGAEPEGMQPFRARSTTFRGQNGNLFSIVSVGVPSEHPMADQSSTVPGSPGLHHINYGGISLPAPQFVVMHRPQEGEQRPTNGAISDNERVEGERIAGLVNDLLRRFTDLFSTHEFLRMRAQYADFDPRNFMTNFQ